ncbi:MAG: Txe/YoeB family addiction module toxin [Lachnospiraceae bacterium]|jgi:toxin YoeB|nr:Txe/YoeB family addiction module toxin [Lachnospiraceae bacterium]
MRLSSKKRIKTREIYNRYCTRRGVYWTDGAWEDFSYWVQNDIKIVKKIERLISDIKKHPYEGIGKPEPLRYDLQGFWSRRISEEHRLIYGFDDDKVIITAVRFLYSK